MVLTQGKRMRLKARQTPGIAPKPNSTAFRGPGLLDERHRQRRNVKHLIPHIRRIQQTTHGRAELVRAPGMSRTIERNKKPM
jgi:hypothetical protein